MHVRVGNPDDVPALCDLASQLGYVVSRSAMAGRLVPFLTRDDHRVFVAVDAGRVVGMVNGGLRRDLCYEDMVELMSLVVTDGARGRGVGKALLAEFEGWARGLGVGIVKLGSREIRRDAHRFYLREDYELEKVHHILRKHL